LNKNKQKSSFCSFLKIRTKSTVKFDNPSLLCYLAGRLDNESLANDLLAMGKGWFRLAELRSILCAVQRQSRASLKLIGLQSNRCRPMIPIDSFPLFTVNQVGREREPKKA
jgi:hypothetical protein